MSKRPIPYFERDGSYNEREPRPKPKPDDSFRLFFDRPITPQLEGKMRDLDVMRFEKLVDAYRTLELAGILPGNRARAAERQINMKADQAIRKFKKEQQ